jgi:hypothetical protein
VLLGVLQEAVAHTLPPRAASGALAGGEDGVERAAAEQGPGMSPHSRVPLACSLLAYLTLAKPTPALKHVCPAPAHPTRRRGALAQTQGRGRAERACAASERAVVPLAWGVQGGGRRSGRADEPQRRRGRAGCDG